jgi:hypothetical protein
MLQTYPGDLEQASPWVMAGMMRALAEEARGDRAHPRVRSTARSRPQ